MYSCDRIYEIGKNGHWKELIAYFAKNPLIAGKAVRYVKESSGWTLLHQAARWGSEEGVAVCLQFGADLELKANNSKTPIQVAAENGHEELAAKMKDAITGKLWKPVLDSTLRAASSKWSEHIERVAVEDFNVGYGGGEVNIRTGDKYYTDSWGRVLVGWGGSTFPPANMDGDPQF